MRSIVLVCALLLSAACSTSPIETATATACFTEREFRVSSDAPGIEIAGSIMTPRGTPRAAVLMITGAGPHTREQRISDTPMFTMIAEHLARRGMIVVRTDSRGFGGSTGPDDDESTTTAERAQDNRAVLAYLRAQPEFRRIPLGLLGHSEGAMIVTMIAADDPRVAFSVLLAPSTIDGREVFSDQMHDNLLRMGATPEVATAVRVQAYRFFTFLANGGERGDEFAAIAHDFLAAHGVPEADNTPAFAQGLISGFLDSRNARAFAGYDPQADLHRVRQPVIAIFASEDLNVRTARHRPALETALQGNPDASITTIADQDHFFFEHDGARLERHVPGEMEVATELYDVLDAALRARGWESQTACAAPGAS